MSKSKTLIDKIASKTARIGIIGLGYVGLPLVIEFAKAGFHVTGFDIDHKKVQMLIEGKTYIKHISAALIYSISERFSATADFCLLSNMDCIIICVPTPLSKYREPDMKHVFSTAHTIAKYMREGQLVVLESTTYPGTTDEDMRAILEKSQLEAGKDFFLAYSPEREDPNNKDFSTGTIPKVVGGYSKECLKTVTALYDSIVTRTVAVSSTKTAEATKLLENIYRAVNIALVNELKLLFDKMGIDVWEVIEAAKTKPFGFQAFYPGPGLGGHCIPIDPFYLTWKAREYDFATRFIELAGQINTYMPYHMVDKVGQVLNEFKKPINGSQTLVIGVAYKKDVDDQRESPALKIISLLKSKGAVVTYSDPHVPFCRWHSNYPDIDMQSVELTKELLENADIALLVTDHSDLDYHFIEQHACCIIDMRNAFRNHGIYSSKIYRA
ncbi:UDP-glucose/GDP-mannose dehydrogenase [Candidatus Magnetoovum chiemensis]|nr:UDP-glucose/GDP-mannose dehydrogenase [Candidatus Magnetoovum chiemensis]